MRTASQIILLMLVDGSRDGSMNPSRAIRTVRSAMSPTSPHVISQVNTSSCRQRQVSYVARLIACTSTDKMESHAKHRLLDTQPSRSVVLWSI